MRPLLTATILLAAISGAVAQRPRNGPEYGGKDHQPTQAEVAQREKQAGVAPSSAQAGQDTRSVQQLDQKLLHDEAVDHPRNAAGAPPQ